MAVTTHRELRVIALATLLKERGTVDYNRRQVGFLSRHHMCTLKGIDKNFKEYLQIELIKVSIRLNQTQNQKQLSFRRTQSKHLNSSNFNKLLLLSKVKPNRQTSNFCMTIKDYNLKPNTLNAKWYQTKRSSS